MAIATVFTRGYGNGTFDGPIPLVLQRGYGGAAVTAPAASGLLFRQPESETRTERAGYSTSGTSRTESIAASVARGVKSTESISKTEKTTEGFSRP